MILIEKYVATSRVDANGAFKGERTCYLTVDIIQGENFGLAVIIDRSQASLFNVRVPTVLASV